MRRVGRGRGRSRVDDGHLDLERSRRRKAQRQGDARARGERRRHVDEHHVESAGRKAHRLAGRQADLRQPYHALQPAFVDVGMDLQGAGSRRRAAEESVGRARVGYGEIGGGRACARRCRADPSVGDRQRPGRGRASGSKSQEDEGTLEVSHESNSRDNESPSYRNVGARRALGTFRAAAPNSALRTREHMAHMAHTDSPAADDRTEVRLLAEIAAGVCMSMLERNEPNTTGQPGRISCEARCPRAPRPSAAPARPGRSPATSRPSG